MCVYRLRFSCSFHFHCLRMMPQRQEQHDLRSRKMFVPLKKNSVENIRARQIVFQYDFLRLPFVHLPHFSFINYNNKNKIICIPISDMDLVHMFVFHFILKKNSIDGTGWSRLILILDQASTHKFNKSNNAK